MPSRNILVINCGSSSIKFALVNEAHSLFPLHGLAGVAWAAAMRCCAGSAAATATA